MGDRRIRPVYRIHSAVLLRTILSRDRCLRHYDARHSATFRSVSAGLTCSRYRLCTNILHDIPELQDVRVRSERARKNRCVSLNSSLLL